MGDDKIYFNITIQHNQNKLCSKERKTSWAETSVEIIDPLIRNTKYYDLCISKFRIDSLTIPLVIPELKQPQKAVDSKIELNYWVKLLHYNESDGLYKEIAEEYLYLVPKDFRPVASKEEIDGNDKFHHANETHWVNDTDGYKIVKPRVKNADDTGEMIYVDNLDPFCYIYEPQEFVDAINNAIARCIAKTSDINEGDYYTSTAYFKLDGTKLKYYQKCNYEDKIIFSENLYKFFGIGFNVKRIPFYEGWMVANDAATRTPCITHRDNFVWRCANPEYSGTTYTQIGANYLHIDEIIDDRGKNPLIRYNVATGQFDVTQSWNVCKSILICSYTLPIKGEYIPTSQKDGLLIHENGARATKVYEEFAGDNDTGVINLGDCAITTPTIKVLESFLPIYAQGGDQRTVIVYTNDAMDVSTKHQLNGDGAQLKKFDISVQWMDIYNNIHHLELQEGSSCDIRLAFVKKTAKQDIIYEGLHEIIRTLGGRDPLAPPPLAKPRLVRTNTTIDLPDTDSYGFKKINN